MVVPRANEVDCDTFDILGKTLEFKGKGRARLHQQLLADQRKRRFLGGEALDGLFRDRALVLGL